MKCPECGSITGHFAGCPFENDPLDKGIEIKQYKLPDLNDDKNFINKNVLLDKEPLVPEKETDFLDNLLKPLDPPKYDHRPLPEYDPFQKTKDPIYPDPLTRAPDFIAPPQGIVLNTYGHDTGIRFTEGGLIKNNLGIHLGKIEDNIIHNHLGHPIGKIHHDGRIMDMKGFFTGTYIDTTVFR